MAPPWQGNLTVERARSICPRSSPGRAALAAARSPAVGRPALRPRDKAMPHAPPQRRRASRGEGPRVERSARAVIHSTAALSRRRPSRQLPTLPHLERRPAPTPSPTPTSGAGTCATTVRGRLGIAQTWSDSGHPPGRSRDACSGPVGITHTGRDPPLKSGGKPLRHD